MICNCKKGFFVPRQQEEVCINGKYRTCLVLQCNACKQKAYIDIDELDDYIGNMAKIETIATEVTNVLSSLKDKLSQLTTETKTIGPEGEADVTIE